jgi:hypothetical protein
MTTTSEATTALTSMTGRTQSFALDPFRVNAITATVARARELADDLTPSQRAMRDAALSQVDALRATGLYSLSPRQR